MQDSNRWLLPAVTFLLGMTLAFFIGKKARDARFAEAPEMAKLTEVLKYIDNYYLDTVNRDQLFKGAVNGMLATLDPHSVYATAEENRALVESLGGGFDGIGVEFKIMNDTVMVVHTISGGPSARIGIRAGDRIVEVNGENIAGVGISNEQVFRKLRGNKGTKVQVGIVRQGFKNIYRYNIKRDKIDTYTLDVSYMIQPSVGYIKLSSFGENTGYEFEQAVGKLKQEGMTSLILDLRGNGGGYLDAAIEICDAFLKNKELIVYTEGLKMPSDRIYATSAGCFEEGNIAVLIDDFSASASEIVAGAVQDNDRGYVIGRRSFGKGLVQQQFNLSDNSSLRLTVARYHTPSGRCIQRKYDEGTDDYYYELYKRYFNGEMDNVDSVKFDESLKYKTKNGRTVYGGGGIMPDCFVPLDRDSNIVAFNEMNNTGLLVEFAFNYTNQHKEQLQKLYPNARIFVDKMRVSDALAQEFIGFYVQKEGQISLNAASNKELKVWLKALIGRNLYRDDAFYPVINATDNTVRKALEVILQNK